MGGSEGQLPKAGVCSTGRVRLEGKKTPWNRRLCSWWAAYGQLRPCAVPGAGLYLDCEPIVERSKVSPAAITLAADFLLFVSQLDTS